MGRTGTKTKRMKTPKQPAANQKKAVISSVKDELRAAATAQDGDAALPKPSITIHKEWKTAVQEYVTLYNQMEIDRDSSKYSRLVNDSDHMQRLNRRLDRLKESEMRRHVVPRRSETHASLQRVNEPLRGGEVTLLLELHIARTIEQYGRSYAEERYERERLWLAIDESGGYSIIRIEPLVLERRPRYSSRQSKELEEDETLEVLRNIGSIPYLNYDILANFKQGRNSVFYRRDLAAAYADQWWNKPNPDYENFEVNCTNYVSQCLFAGQAPMNYTGKRESGWWYRGYSGKREMWSYSWAVAGSLQQFLSAARETGLRAVAVESPDLLSLGDVIIYDWSGDGRYQHSTIVTAFDSSGMPLVNANTVASRHRYWDYRDSYAWTEQTRYRFFHIADEL
ncbi:amidase domain-containing protein [Paenibacillus sp. GCM10027626]|uniref:amidase domain-containing protein n=1 Tax=Paenibacillus sp. GCM10027626 TaxID=3273411 RepID=UPI003630F1D9